MDTKKPKSKQKITDIKPPSSPVGANVPQLVIEKRDRVDHAATQEGPSGAPPLATAVPVVAAPTTAVHEPAKRTVITPPTDMDAPETDAATVPTAQAEAKPPTPQVAANTSSAPNPTAPTQTDTPQAELKAEEGLSATDPDAIDAKAVQEAAAAAKREGELEKYINTKQFYVPINKAAHKRSIKVSLWLTAFYIFLCMVLVNLMLDTGMIFLLHKLPHTNFFSV